MVVSAGVDVGKASLDVSVSEGPVVRFDNTVKGIGKLLKHLKEWNATLVVCEATGGYERPLVSRLRKTDIAPPLTTRTVCERSRRRADMRLRPIRGMPKCSLDTDRYFRMR